MFGPFLKIRGNLSMLTLSAIKCSREGFLAEYGDL